MLIMKLLGELSLALEPLAEIDLGYPQGENVVLPPSRDAVAILSAKHLENIEGLVEFYTACDGVRLPDIHNGYFLRPIRSLIELDDAAEPRVVLSPSPIHVVYFGCTGGGDLLVVDRETGRVLLLPPGSLREGVYNGSSGTVRVVGTGIADFVENLVADVRAFVQGDLDRRYLSDWQK